MLDERWEELGLYRANVQNEFSTSGDRIATVPESKAQPTDEPLPLSRRTSISFSVDDEPFARARGALEYCRLLEDFGIPPRLEHMNIAQDNIRRVQSKLLRDFEPYSWRIAFRTRDPELFSRLLNIGRAALAHQDLIDLYYSRIHGALGLAAGEVTKADSSSTLRWIRRDVQECALMLAKQLSLRLSLAQREQLLKDVLAISNDSSGRQRDIGRQANQLVAKLVGDASLLERTALAEIVLRVAFEDLDEYARASLTGAFAKFARPGALAGSPAWEKLAVTWIDHLEGGGLSNDLLASYLIRIWVLNRNGHLSDETRQRLIKMFWASSSELWPKLNIHPTLLFHITDDRDTTIAAFYKYLGMAVVTPMRTARGGWTLGEYGFDDLLTLLNAFPRPWEDRPDFPASQKMSNHPGLQQATLQVLSWWDSEGAGIIGQMPGSSVAGIFYERLRQATNAAAYVLLPACRGKEELTERLSVMLDAIRDAGVPTEHVRPALLAYTPMGDRQESLSAIRRSIVSRDTDHVASSIEAILHWCALTLRGVVEDVPAELVRELGVIVHARYPMELLPMALEAVKILIEKCPEAAAPLLEDVLVGLDYLRYETSYASIAKAPERVADQLFQIRRVVGSLVPHMNAHLQSMAGVVFDLKIIERWNLELSKDSILRPSLGD